MYGTCAENIFLDLNKENKEHEFDLLWTKLGQDNRIFMREDYIRCGRDDVEKVQRGYNIKLYELDEDGY